MIFWFNDSRTKKTYYLCTKITAMEKTEKIVKQKELIETIGRYMEKQGYQPIAGRVLGLLMVMDKEEFTFDEIVAEMQISKSSVSAALKNLELRNAIEYVTYPNDRKRYFRISFSDVNLLIDEIEKKFNNYGNIIDQVLDLKEIKDSKNAIVLKNIAKGTRFFLSKIEAFKNSNL